MSEQKTQAEKAFENLSHLVSSYRRDSSSVTTDALNEALGDLKREDFPLLYRRLGELRQKERADYDEEVRSVQQEADLHMAFAGHHPVWMDDYNDNEVSAAHIAFRERESAIDYLIESLKKIEAERAKPKKLEQGIVYSTYGHVAADDGIVSGNGIILFYSFNTKQTIRIGYRRSTCVPDFQPNRVEILFAAKDKLFDAGEYGLFDTLDGRLLREGELGSIAYHDGLVYFSSGRVFCFPPEDPSQIKEVPQDILSWNNSFKEKNVRINRPDHVIANKLRYDIRNIVSSPFVKGSIVDQDGVEVVSYPTWIDDAVAFSEEIILKKLARRG